MTLNHTSVGHGPQPLIFLHGLFGQGRNFSSIAKAVGERANSLLPDLPNHGASPWTMDFDYDEQADLVAAWLREQIDGPVALVGHSMGGKMAMRLALRHPELVSKLMVVDISPAANEAVDQFRHLVGAMTRFPLERVSSRTEAEQLLADDVPDVGVRRFLLQNLRMKDGAWCWAANLDLLGDSLTLVMGWPPTDATYDGPVAWVNGANSDYVRPEHAAPMRALFPRTIQVAIKGAGHWVHADQPERFVAVLNHFLDTPTAP
ncbi:alpha/beta fold hydrolase [Tessaracoccus caeni]|uniref:alpha/beta fold hydrolase n=1 Tax=Tessaracoccus caeni TaxID=3031239 RepID=UPI0023DAA284|nr:alpha/beta fold hydrolase [Tessaracoccus caeni]MDF1490362.1 alpha/beta fold hydrolase [Tessaracoccus caeni]